MESSQEEKLQDEVPTLGHDQSWQAGLPDLDPINEGTLSSAATLGHWFLQTEIKSSRRYILSSL